MIEFSDLKYYDKEDLIKILENIHDIVENRETSEN